MFRHYYHQCLFLPTAYLKCSTLVALSFITVALCHNFVHIRQYYSKHFHYSGCSSEIHPCVHVTVIYVSNLWIWPFSQCQRQGKKVGICRYVTIIAWQYTLHNYLWALENTGWLSFGNLGILAFKMHALESCSKFRLITERADITSFYCMSIRTSFFFWNCRFGREGIYVTQNYWNIIFYSN